MSVDADQFKGVQQTAYPAKNGGSMHGLTVAAAGATAYVTGGRDRLFVVDVAANGTFTFSGEINLADARRPTNPLGDAQTPDGKRAVVARSLANDVAIIDLATAQVEARVPVGVCPVRRCGLAGRPLGVCVELRRTPAGKGQKTEPSAGTAVAVDERSIPLTGTVSVIELAGEPRRDRADSSWACIPRNC